jgi:hypothetical protein
MKRTIFAVAFLVTLALTGTLVSCTRSTSEATTVDSVAVLVDTVVVHADSVNRVDTVAVADTLK